ncbi:MAG: chemotaxis protein CheA [Proteobacteria bacterium]|nr:chemotaxis protein CheA [Pseudomonadota bacterium]
MPEIELDPELLSDFIVESKELLDDFTAKTIELESNPDDPAAIGAIFRAAHTLKGSSAFFNLTHIKNFAHKLENLLDEIRNKRLTVTADIIYIILNGGNHLKSMFDRVSSGDYGLELTSDEESFLKSLLELLESKPTMTPEETLHTIKNLTLEFKKTGTNPEKVLEKIDALLADFAITTPSGPADGRPAATGVRKKTFRLGQVDLPPLAAAVALIEQASEKGEIDADAYDQALADLEVLVKEKELAELEAPLEVAAEDFRAIKQSGIDFDTLLIGMVKGRLDDVLKHVETVEEEIAVARPPAGLGSYRLGDVELEPLGRAVGIIEAAAEKGKIDSDAYDQALADLEALVKEKELADLEAPLATAAEDFRAIKQSGIDFDALLIGMVKDRLEEIVSRVAVSFAEMPPPGEAPPKKESVPTQTPPPAKAGREDRLERKTMRIDEDKVDGFMNYVGELIVTAETFNYLQKMIENEKINPTTIRAFKNANQAFRELSSELQAGLMEIRRVPLKALLQKVTLMARDLAHQMGKQVKVQMEGQDVQIDKSIAESLEGPLVHVIRNSMDHGLETTDVREQAGKSPEGLLRVTATADKEFFYLEVFDDGHGIDPDRMRSAAVKKGLMSESQAAAITDREAVNLIFGAGFSTAEKITDVSGRGVGMDVVRTNISQLNGSINVESTVGRHATISFKIPLSVTLQVVKALLVRVGSADFIISLDDIVETIRVGPGELSTIEGRGEVIMRRGNILPLIRLYEAFDIEPRFTDPSQAILVVIETPRGIFGLLVDEVLGQQQVVVKDLGSQFKNLYSLAGSAILGDGRLGLVLNPEGVVQLAQGG